YQKWCKTNNFKSMLPTDVKACNAATAVANAKQSSLDDHVRVIELGECVLPYTDKLFREAVIEWLISTNQPIQAVDHPSLKKMIDIASQATNGVVIPTWKTTCAEIMSIFKKQMTRLQECLNVS
ncbi:hypothetical protein BDN67DRAFT_873223, partial [Paxillus ammoniavirescens]